MSLVVRTIDLSLAAGLHAALYGAWKDSPHESFKPGSFMRELLIATFVGIVLCFVSDMTTPFLIFLSAFTLCRIVNAAIRFLLGVGWLGAITAFTACSSCCRTTCRRPWSARLPASRWGRRSPSAAGTKMEA
jgi:hypothetical protein